MNRRSDDPRGITPDELFALLSGTCQHEIQSQRLMAILGALAARNGGTIMVKHDEILALANHGLSIEGSETGIIVTVAPDADEGPKQPTHSAPSTHQ